jgi:hypothetical protein
MPWKGGVRGERVRAARSRSTPGPEALAMTNLQTDPNRRLLSQTALRLAWPPNLG